MVKNFAVGQNLGSGKRWAAWLAVLVGLWMPATAQLRDTLRGAASAGGLRIPFTVLVKQQADDPDSKIPVFVFLHGAGERGIDNRLQLTVGLPALMKSLDSIGVPNYLIYAPQCPLDQKWVDTDWTALGHHMATELNPPLLAALQGFDSIMEAGDRLDRNRIYLTGISMGGFGVWELLQRFPKKVAGAIPICGGGDPAFATTLAATPIWAFHGQKDKLVKVSRTTEMVAAIQKAGGHAQMTIFENYGHLCWNYCYQDLKVIEWLLSQERND